MEIILTSEQEAQLTWLAAHEGLTPDELARDVLIRGLADEARSIAAADHGDDIASEQRREIHAEREWQRARELGVPADDQAITDEYRQAIREQIAEGVRSLRAGRTIDGETFMAQMTAELAELERQGR